MKLSVVAMMAVIPCLAAIPEVDKAKALGNPAAPVRMEIFSDFACPHCKKLHEEVVPMLMRDFVIPGKVYLIDRAFPINAPGHQYSREAFGYSVAAARIGKYQEVADALYAQQEKWAVDGTVWQVVAGVVKNPADQKKIKELSKDPGVLAEIEAEYQEGVQTGLSQTPTLVLIMPGKRIMLPPAPNYEFLKQTINGFLPK
jgi:protein-disulfide isomerase